ncbi:DUF1835 domain-containing protein [Aestuariibacter sp. AA17]|uniref:DUF1835 domain-containing protein n=1 Tax=Fluctibacter corallii TaxID=2984329 RepID=A0ABT3A8U3_9ALTE|nr:DUF1835 domain-containing protein [Aestuariibacter sp. AA17]
MTNGDTTVKLIDLAGISGQCVPWRDLLHMGPVPMTPSINELSAIRAQFIASLGWGDFNTIHQDFLARDKALSTIDANQPVVLWFEHDLYDQLQLIQVLSELNVQNVPHENVFWVDTSIHLGRLLPADYLELISNKKAVTPQMFALANEAWNAYRQTTPEAWSALRKRDLTSLPYLKNAIERSLQELPWTNSGLNFTEKTSLALIHEGHNTPTTLFQAYCAHEKAEFHGDMSYFWYIDQLHQDSPPLLSKQQDTYHLTENGKSVLKNGMFWQRAYGQSQWLGGYELSSTYPFLWDDTSKRLIVS